MTEQSIRASEAPIVLECGLAATPPEVEIDTAGPDAALGSAVHDSIDGWWSSGRIGEPEPQPHANQHGVDPHAVAEIAGKAPAALAEIREDLSQAESEVPITGGLVRGRMDLASVWREADLLQALSVLDWKTGRDPTAGSKPAQRLAYASALHHLYGMPATGYVYAAEVWLAADVILESRFDEAAILGFRARIAERLARPRANPGTHCRYCRRRHECTERDEYIRSCARALAEPTSGLMTAEEIAALWDQSRALRAALEAYDKAVDLVIDEHGGLDLPDGRRVEHMTVSRDRIDARKAWPTLERLGLNADAINASLTVSKTELMKQVSKLAPRGKKQDAKADAMTALDLAGAITRTTSRRKKVT